MRRLTGAALSLAVLLATACGGGDKPEADVADRVREQLTYLDPRSAAVVAVDLRWEGPNWKHLRRHINRGLKAYRDATPPADRGGVPSSIDSGFSAFLGGSITDALNGYMVLGFVEPPRPDPADVEQSVDDTSSIVAVLRTPGKDIRAVAGLLGHGDFEPRKMRGHSDVTVIENFTATVGKDTLLVIDGGGGARELRAAVERHKREGAGFPTERLAAAQRQTGLDDPFLLAAGDAGALRARVVEEDLRRARREVPWLGALRGFAGGVEIDERGGFGTGRVTTDPAAVSDADVPVAAAGPLELPGGDTGAAGTRDAGRSLRFASSIARALDPESGYAKAVAAAERDLRLDFEDDVLREAACPGLAAFEPALDRFGLRSCAEDPERVRGLLRKLSPHLPRIVAGATAADPERVVAQMAGDDVVVASDRDMAERAAGLDGTPVDDDAGAAFRIPLRALELSDAGAPDRALLELLGETTATLTGDRSSVRAEGRLTLDR